MKKITVWMAATLLSVLFASSAMAQAILGSNNNDFRYGLQLGMNLPSFGEEQYSNTIGWNVGATVLYNSENFIPNSYCRASLLYTRRGASAGNETLKYKGTDYKLNDATYYLHYLEIPIRFGYAYEFNDMVCGLLETGPYFGFRMAGSLRCDDVEQYVGNGYQSTEHINCSMKEYYDDLRRFNCGWGVYAGALIDKKYQCTVGWDWGLCDVVPDVTGLNLNFSINLAVYFD